MTNPDSTQLARQVPGVDLGEEIGRGGFARVFRGVQVAVNREVAVKIDSRPLDDERNRRRFLREATASGRISGHPHVVSLIDVGTTRDNRPYLVMELCPNGSLSQLLRATGPLRVDEARELGLAVTGALAAAHEAGILHRDVKPANILIDAYGTPRLSDFGLAALPSPDRELSVTLEALTPAYASPETFSSQDPTTASDVWSMGATLHAMISNSSPRRSPDGSPPSVEYLMEHLADPFPDPEVPGSAALMDVIRVATAFDPGDRYPTARELYDALKALPIQTQPGSRVTGGPEASFSSLPNVVPRGARPATPTKRWPLAVAAGVVGALLGAGGSAIMLTAAGDSQDTPGPDAGVSSSPTGDASGDGGDVSATPPELGACWGGITTISSKEVTSSPLDCADPHYWETYASGILDPNTATPYATDLAKDPVVLSTCTKAALKNYLPTKKGAFQLSVIPPDQLAWAAGERGFSCVAAAKSAGEVTGPLR